MSSGGLGKRKTVETARFIDCGIQTNGLYLERFSANKPDKANQIVRLMTGVSMLYLSGAESRAKVGLYDHEQPLLTDIGSELQSFLSERSAEPVALLPREGEEVYPYYSDDETAEPILPPRVVKFRHYQELPAKLPQGYCYMGGVARSIVLRELGQNTMPPRDIDIVAVKDFSPDLDQIEELSKQYMEDDVKHGYGIKSESMAPYFSNRDFTLNEILIHGDEVYVSTRALEDLSKHIIRPSEYEQSSWRAKSHPDEKGVHPKLVMKALRMQTEFDAMYGDGNIEGIKKWQWNIEALPLFYIALHLKKAYEQGDALATRYFSKLLELGVAGPEINSDQIGGKDLREFTLSIQYRLLDQGKDPFDFPVELHSEEQSDETLYDHYADLANTYKGSNYHKLGEMLEY